MRFRKSSLENRRPWKSLMSPSVSRPDPGRPTAEEIAAEVEAIAREIAGEAGVPSAEVAVPEKPAFPSATRDEPLRALKAAGLMVTRTGMSFTALNGGGLDPSGPKITYGPEAVAECRCNYGYGYTLSPSAFYGGGIFSSASVSFGTGSSEKHLIPAKETTCGFYAWKRGETFPFDGTWLLEVDLYGTVIEHEKGYRAQKQRVLRISPIPAVHCEGDLTLAAGEGGAVTARCPDCPPADVHPVSVALIRRLLNVEVDMYWAREIRDEQWRSLR